MEHERQPRRSHQNSFTSLNHTPRRRAATRQSALEGDSEIKIQNNQASHSNSTRVTKTMLSQLHLLTTFNRHVRCKVIFLPKKKFTLSFKIASPETAFPNLSRSLLPISALALSTDKSRNSCRQWSPKTHARNNRTIALPLVEKRSPLGQAKSNKNNNNNNNTLLRRMHPERSQQ